MKWYLIFGLLLFSCQSKNYTYEIHKTLYYNDKPYEGVWYTDSIDFLGDTVFYKNSDGSRIKISPPYILIDKTKI